VPGGAAIASTESHHIAGARRACRDGAISGLWLQVRIGHSTAGGATGAFDWLRTRRSRPMGENA